MKIYLAGPMRGIPDLNRPAFAAAAAELRKAHSFVFNPAEPVDQGTIREAFAMDMAWICSHADAVALLPGWRHSLGAVAEHALALALGLKVIEL